MRDGHSIPEIGEQLLKAANARAKTPAETLTELFPYVHEAARRISTRAISRWLSETHEIQISHATIARALAQPTKFWQAFAEFVEPSARQVEEATGVGFEDFLAEEALFSTLPERPKAFSGTKPEGWVRTEAQFREAFAFLEERWFKLSEETRDEVLPYLHEEQTDEEAAK